MMTYKVLIALLAISLMVIPMGAACNGGGVTDFEGQLTPSDDTAMEELQASYDSLKLQYDELLADYESLLADYESLQGDNDLLQTNYDSLKDEHESLQAEYDLLLLDYDALQADYDDALSDCAFWMEQSEFWQGNAEFWQTYYYDLQSDYDTLELQYETSEALRIGQLLADYYDNIREYFDDTGAIVTWQDYVEFASGLARHSMGQAEWALFESDYYDRASPNEYSYNTAEREFGEVMDLVDLQAGDSDVVKIEKILQFINDNIQYEHDLYDSCLAPMETLGHRSGDCDDFATLVAAMFEYAGIESAFGIFENTSSGSYHAMALVHMDSLSPYVCINYSDLTSFGLQSGQWLAIEPQFTIEDQYEMSQYDLSAAAEV